MIVSYLFNFLILFTMSQSKDETSGQSRLLGFRISKYSSFFPFSCSDDMLIPELSEGTEVTIRIVGHLANAKDVALTSSTENCASVYPGTIASIEKESDEVGSVMLTTPTNLPKKKTTLYYCFRAGKEDEWIHQGVAYWAKLIIVQRYTTVYAVIVGCVLSVFFAALLNTSLLRLLSLDVATLEAKAESGTEKEKMVCHALIRLRKRGYLIVMALIPSIVFFKTTLTVFLRIISNGWLAIIVSTITIVLLVEVIPRIKKREENESMEGHTESSVISKYKEDDPCLLPVNTSEEGLRLTASLLSKQGSFAVDGEKDPEPPIEPPSQRGQEQDTATSSNIQGTHPEQENEPSTGGDQGPSRSAYYRRTIRRPRRRETTPPETPHQEPSSGVEEIERFAGPNRLPSTQGNIATSDIQPEQQHEQSTGGDQGPSRSAYCVIRRPRQTEPSRDEASHQESSTGPEEQATSTDHEGEENPKGPVIPPCHNQNK